MDEKEKQCWDRIELALGEITRAITVLRNRAEGGKKLLHEQSDDEYFSNKDIRKSR